jgi:hypothetical protein
MENSAQTLRGRIWRGGHRLKSPPQSYNDFKKFGLDIGGSRACGRSRPAAPPDSATSASVIASSFSGSGRREQPRSMRKPQRPAYYLRAYYPQLPASDPSIPDDKGRQGRRRALPSAARRAVRAITSFISVDHALFIAALVVILATIVRL